MVYLYGSTAAGL